MKCINYSKAILMFIMILLNSNLKAQIIDDPANSNSNTPKSEFWKKVSFGGGIGLNIGSGFTNISVSPAAIYNINPYFSAGVGLQGSYVSLRNEFNSIIYGGSIIGLANPVQMIQLSAELEQVRLNTTVIAFPTDYKENAWNTALFIGAGYRTRNITIGVRYNVLHNENSFLYSDPFMPFVRIFF